MRRRTENPSFSALSKAIAQVEQVHTTAHRLTREVPYLFTEPVRGGIPVSAGHVKKPDLLCMRPVERTDRLGGGLQQNLAALLREISRGFRREMHIAHLARAENELLASPLEDELRFIFREHVRGAVVLLRQLLLPLHHLPRKANDHIVLIGLSVDRDGAECGAFDLHGLTLIPDRSTRL
jgi:hypothetical protein